MKHIFGRFILTDHEAAIVRAQVNRAPGSTMKFKALQLLKEPKNED